RMEKHRTDPNCASCHKRMDPIGFALENYDATGAWRDQDQGKPIDTAAEFPDGSKVNGILELKKIADACAKNDYSMTTLMVEIVKSYPFLNRQKDRGKR